MQDLNFKIGSASCTYMSKTHASKTQQANLKSLKIPSVVFRLSLCICLFQIYLFQVAPVAAFQEDQTSQLTALRSDSLRATEDTSEDEDTESSEEEEETVPEEEEAEISEEELKEEGLFSTTNLALAALLAGGAYFLNEEDSKDSIDSKDSVYTWGYDAIGASSANSNGYTGAGVKVSVVDSGVDVYHQDFNDNSSHTNCSDDACYGEDDPVGHGTHVASTIFAANDGKGITGVAYGASLYSYKFSNSAGDFYCSESGCDSWSQSIIGNMKSKGVDVSNNSWGTIKKNHIKIDVLDYLDYFDDNPLSKQAILDATNPNDNPIIFVFAAGNDKHENPSPEAAAPYLISDADGKANVEAHWLSVIAVDSNMKEADFTNRCGVAADWCVAAPGVDIVAAQAGSGDGYVSMSGTSMAAPHVSGAVAVLLERFGALTPAEVVTRLKEGATCAGLSDKYGNINTSAECSAAMKLIFGHGFISLDNSLSALGSLTYAGGSTWDSAKSVNLNTARVPLPTGFAAALGRDFQETEVAVFDSFDGATFWLKAQDVFEFDQEREVAAIGYASSAQNQQSHSAGAFGDTNVSLRFSTADSAWQLGGNTQWEGHAAALAPASFFKNRTTRQTEFIARTAGSNMTPVSLMSLRPFIQHEVDQGNMSVSGLGVNADLSLSTGTDFALSMLQSKQAVNFSSSQSLESDIQADTLTLDFGARQRLGTHIEMFGRASVTRLGQVEVTQDSWGLEEADLVSAVMGMETHVNEQIRLTTGLWQPAQLSSGTARYMAPVGRERDGTVIWEKKTAALEESVDPALFMSLTTSLSERGRIALTVQQSPWERDRIGRAEIRGTMAF